MAKFKTISFFNIKSLFDNTKSSGNSFEIFIQLLIFISIITFSFETLPDLSSGTIETLNLIEVVCVSIFTFEYLGRIVYSKKGFRYIYSFYGLIDLIAILPFYISLGIDLRSIRILRLLRLFRILKLPRFNKAIRILAKSINSIKAELSVVTMVALVFIYLSSVGIYFFENEAQPENFKSIFHSIWWAIATLTTVGYGDVYPITLGGKIFSSVIILIGIGIIAIPTGLIASSINQNLKN
jgi:voltage-gated potassium channel